MSTDNLAQMHYQDGSHRWIAPDGIDQKQWDEKMRFHLDDHRHDMGNENRLSPIQSIYLRYAGRRH